MSNDHSLHRHWYGLHWKGAIGDSNEVEVWGSYWASRVEFPAFMAACRPDTTYNSLSPELDRNGYAGHKDIMHARSVHPWKCSGDISIGHEAYPSWQYPGLDSRHKSLGSRKETGLESSSQLCVFLQTRHTSRIALRNKIFEYSIPNTFLLIWEDESNVINLKIVLDIQFVSRQFTTEYRQTLFARGMHSVPIDNAQAVSIAMRKSLPFMLGNVHSIVLDLNIIEHVRF
jgi:hypothetical protein